MSTDPEWVVIRKHPDLPDGVVTDDWEGRWLDVSSVPPPVSMIVGGTRDARVVATRTDRFEVHPDVGAMARVYVATIDG